VAAAAAATNTPPPFANKLTLCAINRTPNGALAVGFVDGGTTPAHNYYLDVGEDENGFTVLNADIDEEFAVIDKDGTSVTLRLPGSNRHVNPILDPATEIAAVDNPDLKQPRRAVPPPRPMFTNAVEQLLSMELSIPPGLQNESKKALGSLIVIETNDTDAAASQKELVGIAKVEMADHIQAGGTAVSYLQTLKERRNAEIARQQEARAAAEAQIQELAKKLSQDELNQQLDAINKTLTDTGVAPIDAPE
jgi:hypothetical protein